MESDQKLSKRKTIWTITIVSFVLLGILLIANLTPIKNWVNGLYFILRPTFYGLVLAYIVNPLFRLFEQKIFCKVRPFPLRRVLSLTVAFLLFFAAVALLFALFVPQLVKNLANLAFHYDAYIEQAVLEINRTFDGINDFFLKISPDIPPIEHWETATVNERLLALFGADSGDTIDMLRSLDTTSIFSVIGNIFGVMRDFLFGLCIAVYLLYSKELRGAQLAKLRNALLSSQANENVEKFVSTANRSFGRFLFGRVLDSVIVFLISYFAFLIFKIPYAILMALLIGIMNIIPIIGPFLGAIPALLTVLIIDPAKILPLLIIVILVQQIDSNIIGPAVIGGNTGISALCVLIAVSTAGSLWGIPGMILGAPIFATVLEYIRIVTVDRLQKKGLPSDIQNYYPSDSLMDPEKNADLRSDRLRMKYEKRILATKLKEEHGEQLSFADRIHLAFYDFGRKYHFLERISDKTILTVTVETAEKRIRRQFRKSCDGQPPADEQNSKQ